LPPTVGSDPGFIGVVVLA